MRTIGISLLIIPSLLVTLVHAQTESTLSNNQTVSVPSMTRGEKRYYSITVPSGSTNLRITTTGSTGDADIYISRGKVPTRRNFSWSSTKYRSTESVLVRTPVTDTYYVLLYAYSNTTNTNLTVAYTGGTGTTQTPSSGANTQTTTPTPTTTTTSSNTSAPTPTTTTSWTYCAAENTNCIFTGRHRVLYGTSANANTGIIRIAENYVSCDNTTFTDPAVGQNKSCWYENTTTTLPLTTTTTTTTNTTTQTTTTTTTQTTTSSPTSTTPAGTVPSGNVSTTFTSSSEDFLNPERGFYITPSESEFGSVATLQGFVQEWNTRLFLDKENLGSYRTQSLPKSYLDGLSARLANVRVAGTKVVLQFAYGYDSGSTDTTINWVQTHTSQLKPIIVANADVIAYLKMGIIGPWGEWDSSNNGLETKEGKRAVKDAIFAMAPDSTPVMSQEVYPMQEDWYANQQALGSSEAFNGSQKSRTGLVSDCYLTGNGDSYMFTGPATVYGFNITKSRQEQRQYTQAFTEYAPFGGETCADSGGASQQMRTACSGGTDEIGQSGGILNEGPRYHLTWLNVGYAPNFIQSWKDGGCFSTVSRSMGYRFQLDSINHPGTAGKGSTIIVNVDLRDIGWSRIFSARKLVVTLKNKSTGETIQGSAGDMRLLPSQATASTRISVPITIPSTASTGDYDVYVSMPDIYTTTANIAAYAVRFANADNSSKGQAWDATTARFKVGTTLTITTGTPTTTTSQTTVVATPTTTVVSTPVTTSTAAPTISNKFSMNSRIVVSTGPINVRDAAYGNILDTQPTGALGTIVGGPTVANGVTWWKVDYDTGTDGWSFEDYISSTNSAAVTTQTSTPAPTPVQSGNPSSSGTAVNGTLIASTDWSLQSSQINSSTYDSTNGWEKGVTDAVGTSNWLHRTAADAVQVVTVNGTKYLKTTIADGRNWLNQGYDRAEYSIASNFVDGQKYVMEWKGMIPSAWPTNGTVTVMMQVHMNNNGVPSFSFEARNGRLFFVDFMDPQDTDPYGGNNPKTYDLGSLTDFINTPVTLRITLVSSLSNGYVKLEKNGSMVMERSGRTTLVAGGDWLKDGTLYDWGTSWVDPAQASRGRSYSLLTEYSRIWQVQ